ncbi:MAG: hypothetical protein J6C09_00745 [Clostridia bacterium]|nr:hypothetical protein [Clostridia bacterium]
MMGKLYARFKELKKQAAKNGFSEKVGLVKLEEDNKKYEIYFPLRRANRYSIIHCVNNTVEWEQFPVLPRIAGRLYGIREPIISLSPSKECIRIVVILGKPNSIIGLDEGIFRSVHRYDEKHINVMSVARFKEL